MSTLGQMKYVNHMMHLPAPMSMIPHPFLSFTDRMTYFERLHNVFFHTFEDLMSHLFHFPLQVRTLNVVDFKSIKIIVFIFSKTFTIVILKQTNHH